MQFPQSVWDDPSVLAPAQEGLAALPEFSGVVGPLNPERRAAHDRPADAAPRRRWGRRASCRPCPTTHCRPGRAVQRVPRHGPAHQPDGHTVQYSVEFGDGDASTPAVLETVPPMRADVGPGCAGRRSIGERRLRPGRRSPTTSATSRGPTSLRIIPIVAILIALLLAIVLRSLVAPIYLVASIVLSYLAALGLVGIVFVHLGGQDGINFILPFLMFVFLMALGSDYNILIMSRIREEAHALPLRDAVARAIGRTGSTITTAGMILARHLRGPGRRRRLGRWRSDPADRLRRGGGRPDGHVPAPIAARAVARRAARALELVAVAPRPRRRAGAHRLEHLFDGGTAALD